MRLHGDYHIHTSFSRDAKGTVDEVAKEAKQKGIPEIAITEHGVANRYGADPKHFPHLKALCEKAGEDYGINVLFGIEANVIGTRGQIDVTEEDKALFDIINCGIHRSAKPADLRTFFTFFLPNNFWALLRWFPKGRIRKNTQIMKRVIEQNNITVWVHPGTFFKLDVVEVAKTCVERGTLLELNGARISFRPIDFERCIALGAKFIIGSDAHKPENVGRTHLVSEFLSQCDFKPGDIVNLEKPLIGKHKEATKKEPEEPVSVAVKEKKKWWSKN